MPLAIAGIGRSDTLIIMRFLDGDAEIPQYLIPFFGGHGAIDGATVLDRPEVREYWKTRTFEDFLDSTWKVISEKRLNLYFQEQVIKPHAKKHAAAWRRGHELNTRKILKEKTEGEPE